jgi:hypothetical protein
MGLEGLVSKRRESTYRAGRFAELGQGQEPQASRDVAGHGHVWMSEKLKHLSLAQMAVRVAFACVATGLVGVMTFLALEWFFGAP